MNITYLKNNTSQICYTKTIDWALDRIKNGELKDVINKARVSYGTIEYDKIKNSLSAVIFTGEFKFRTDKGLVEPSGLCILDFDKVKDVNKLKDKIINDEYTFACWLSPSGVGLKVLVKIPKCFEKHEFESYYDGLKEKYKEVDPSGRNPSRLCYESYDPDIYINYFSKVWEVKGVKELNFSINKPVFYIEDEIKKVGIINKWFYKKYDISKGNRNNSFLVLAKTYNDFGINENHCINEITRYESSDFKQEEINSIVKSGYKDKSKFGSCFFEDKEVRKEIETDIYKGLSLNDIILKHDKPKNLLIKAFNETKENNINFWEVNKSGRFELNSFKFQTYLSQNGFAKINPNVTSKEVIFVKKDKNFLNHVTDTEIKDFVLNDLINRDVSAFNFMAINTKFFSFNYLNIIPTEKLVTKKDTQTESYLFFKNGVVEITKKGYKLIDYIQINGYVWQKQIINRDFVQSDHHNSVYRRFLWLISGQSIERYNSLKSVIGYLLHSFKTSANNKAIILNDEVISEDPNGGSGKGLFCSAIGKLKKTSSIDGKNFEFTKTFPYQTVSLDTQVLVFDDVKKRFDFESLFSLITEGITLEYKGKDAIKLDVSESPKVVITTNYTIGGASGSHERRKFEVELSSYFSAKHTPLKEFGHLLFDEWDIDEWARFDNFMCNCCVYYMQNGLVAHEFTNLNIKRIIRETNSEFVEFINDYDPPNDYIEVKELLNAFLNENPNFKKNPPSTKRFKKWLELCRPDVEFNKDSITRRINVRFKNSDNAPW